MHVGYHLKLEQSQKLIMTPELRQAIALLQMSTQQLLEYVQEELTSNPVLEWEEEREKKEENNDENAEKESRKEEDFPWDEYFQENFYESAAVKRYDDDNSYSLENFCRGEETFSESICSQLRLFLEEEHYPLGEFLVGCLDSNGYLGMEPEEIASTLNVCVEKIQRVLELIQQNLEPAGIGARNLKECLLIQLKRSHNYPSLAETLVSHHLTAIADGRFSLLADKLDVEMPQLIEAVDYIKSLNPKPGSLLGTSHDIRYIIPDVLVEKVEGEYIVTINDSVTPSLKINPYYRSLMYRQEAETSSFVKKYLDRALWLVKSIEQRRLTLYRVSEHIVKAQKEFLDNGLKHLKPLTLRDVAEDLELHESTVSRATAHKYLQTPRGVFPFKFFFSSRVAGQNGENHSSTSIKTYLKELIQEEPSASPYSDSKITSLLEELGIDISRRTVAKYREEMLIPASHKRKRA